MKRNTVIGAALGVTLAVSVLCSTVAWSQSRPERPAGGRGGAAVSCPAVAIMPPQAAAVDRIAETLQLTDDQTTQLKEILTKADKTVRPLSQKSAEATKALCKAITASEYNAKNVKELADKAEIAESAVISAGIDVWTQIRSILTAEQASKLQETVSIMSGPAGGPGQGGQQGQRPDGPPPMF